MMCAQLTIKGYLGAIVPVLIGLSITLIGRFLPLIDGSMNSVMWIGVIIVIVAGIRFFIKIG